MAEGDVILDCNNKELISLYTLLASCFGKDSEGNVYLRTEQYEQSGGEEDAVSCGDNVLLEKDQFEMLLRKSIVQNAEGKPAIRLGFL